MATDEELTMKLKDFLRSSNLETTNFIDLQRLLEAEFCTDLSHKTDFLVEQVNLFLSTELEGNGQDEAEMREDGVGGDEDGAAGSNGEEEDDLELKVFDGMSLPSLNMEGTSLTNDRMSDLPDEILAKMLSYLSAEENLSTWLLSKRWSRVWASVHVLYFRNWYITKQRDAKFLSFVKGVLHHRDLVPLDTFYLLWCCRDSTLHSQCFEVLSDVKWWMPREVYITIETDNTFKLPSSIFTTPSVESMSLKYPDETGGSIKVSWIDLPRVKRLFLKNWSITDDFLTKLFLGCPVLEELFFSTCSLDMQEISSPVLKRLTIDCCCLHDAIEIYCPSVTYLDLYTWCSLDISLKNLTSLLTAKFEWDQDDTSPKLQLFSGISNVENLSFDTCAYDILVMSILNLQSEFHNLR